MESWAFGGFLEVENLGPGGWGDFMTKNNDWARFQLKYESLSGPNNNNKG